MPGLSPATPPPALADRFRGTVQRWTLDDGPLAGTRMDCSFHTDWSLDWRVVAGRFQGRLGRARVFVQQSVRAQLFLVSFAMGDGERLTATVDFASRRLVGVLVRGDEAIAVGGALQVL
jgi:hypothetical protein